MLQVSVIVPTFNRAHLLGRALDSILAQTMGDFEVIVVDDDSSDDTPDRVAALSDRRIRYTRHETNLGGAQARNTGIRLARAPFTAFCDSDDAWVEDKLEKQLHVIANAGSTYGVVYTGYLKIGWPHQPPSPRYRGDLHEKLLVRNWVGSTSTPLIRTPLLHQVHGFDPDLPSCQDWDLWIRLSRECRFDFIDEILVKYYHQSTSISMDRQASIRGHKMISRKYAREIQKLSRPLRARHHTNLAINFWWKKAFASSLHQFGLSLLYDPRTCSDIVSFLFARIKKNVPF